MLDIMNIEVVATLQYLVPDTYPAGGTEVDTTVIAGSVEINVVVDVTK